MSTTNETSRKKLVNALNEELRNNSSATILFHQSIANKLGLNPTDHKCLEVILKNQPITAGELAEITGLTTGTITGVINRLEGAGYAFRDNDPQDKRRVIISVNQDKAKEEIVPLFSSFSGEIYKMLSEYTDQELQLILDFIKSSNRVLLEMKERMSNTY
ncbi:MarR family transcriptional regulator [Neobacillus piezotolerans]|uniref:MarR family transcriptional regulator n=1 Tax=Neobacillus piezotolerans TaxID=2259171 RepID=A0A3D8GS53_9BACI|nr:MarR family transcriptional regulator [Neobacillus piezotolerans]RDU37157.1 MarR family transcriptional regulator [Neobacillus piezotolerans]